MASAKAPFGKASAVFGKPPRAARTAKPRSTHTTSGRLEMFLISATVFLSPMNYLRTDLIYFTLSDLFALATVLLMLATRRLATQPFGRQTPSWYAAVALFLFGLMLGSLVKGNPTTATTVFAQYIFSFVLLPMAICARPHSEIIFLVKIFVVSVALIMLHGAFMMAFNPDDVRFVSRSGRMYGLVERENATGALGAVALVFCQWLYFSRKISVAVLLLLSAPIAYGILLTGSNTGFFLALIGSFLLIFLNGSLRLLAASIVVAFAVLAVVALWGEYFLPEIFVKRVYGALQSGDTSQAGTFEDRFALNQEALELARETIWIGLGIEQYRVVSAHGAPVHNTYLLTLTEGGLISLIGLICLPAIAFYIGWRAFFGRHTHLSGALTITYVCLFALSLNGFAHIYARFWAIPLLLAMSVSLSQLVATSRPR